MKKIMLKTDWATKHPVSPFWSFEISAEDLAKQLSVEEFGKFFNAYLLRKTKECCKYSVISHGIGLSGEVEEIKVHCKMNPENDYTEHLKEYLSYKDFELKVKEILTWDGGIGSTDQDLIKWKTHEIMKLAEIPIDKSKE